ncbi:MAG: hypothetical protein NC200_07935 [Candidatus Gastranaerophilales bacterium]|nr:hypothetical protein [Candidatus Gastranaerophilales bacterium]
MKKACLLILTLFVSMPFCFALSLKSDNVYGSARNYAKYYPQTNYSNRYRKQQKSYVFTPQQAKYYGYRVPTQQTNSYYNPYTRGY